MDASPAVASHFKHKTKPKHKSQPRKTKNIEDRLLTSPTHRRLFDAGGWSERGNGLGSSFQTCERRAFLHG